MVAAKNRSSETNLSFGQVVRAAQRLKPEEKAALVMVLQSSVVHHPVAQGPVTRESLLAEFAARRTAGAFETTVSAKDLYPASSLEYVSDEELRAAIREAATAYQEDLEELGDHPA